MFGRKKKLSNEDESASERSLFMGTSGKRKPFDSPEEEKATLDRYEYSERQRKELENIDKYREEVERKSFERMELERKELENIDKYREELERKRRNYER